MKKRYFSYQVSVAPNIENSYEWSVVDDSGHVHDQGSAIGEVNAEMHARPVAVELQTKQEGYADYEFINNEELGMGAANQSGFDNLKVEIAPDYLGLGCEFTIRDTQFHPVHDNIRLRGMARDIKEAKELVRAHLATIVFSRKE